MIAKKERGSHLLDENNVVGVDHVVERQEHIGIRVGSFSRRSPLLVAADYLLAGFDKLTCTDGAVSTRSRHAFHACNQSNGTWGVSQFLLRSGTENEKTRGVVTLPGEKLRACPRQALARTAASLEAQWPHGETLMVLFRQSAGPGSLSVVFLCRSLEVGAYLQQVSPTKPNLTSIQSLVRGVPMGRKMETHRLIENCRNVKN